MDSYDFSFWESYENFLEYSLFAFAGYIFCKFYRQRKSGKIIEQLNLDQDENGFYALNFEEMQAHDPEQFFKITRMTPKTFDVLRALIEPRLEQASESKPILPSSRLFLVLMYLSQGVPKRVLAWMFRMGYATVGEIIYETCDVLWKVLMPLYMAPPSEEKWRQISEDFYTKWNLPNCVSAIDGKHIKVQCPPRLGSDYTRQFRGYHSIVLLATCDANHTFTAVDIVAHESHSFFGQSTFGKKLPNLPPPKTLPDSNTTTEHYLIADAAFPLKTFLMRPYPGLLIDEKKLYFNKRLSRARRVTESTFGVLVARWRILQTTLNMPPTHVDRVVKACTVLHNFVKLNDDTYCTQEYVDTYDDNDVLLAKGLWRNEAHPLHGVRSLGSTFSSKGAFGMREAIKEYLFQNKK